MNNNNTNNGQVVKRKVDWYAVRTTIYAILVYIAGAASIKISIWATLIVFIALFIIPKIKRL